MKKSMLAFMSVIAFSAFSAYAQPKLTIIGGDKYDWGKVKPKDIPLSAKIQVKNTGNEELSISNVKPACGCTTAPLEKDKLKPGETTFINLTFRPNTGSAGVQSKTVQITSNDPQNPNQTLKIQADLVKNLNVTPTQFFTFNEMEVGKSASSTLTITNTSNKSITLSDLKVSPTDLKVNVPAKKVLKAGESMDVKATYIPTKDGYMNANVKFKTDDTDMPELELSGYGNVKASAVFNNGNNSVNVKK